MKSLLIFRNKILLCSLIIVIGFFPVFAIKAYTKDAWRLDKKSIENTSFDKDSLVQFAQSLKGEKYCYGTCKPGAGFDCSGFVYYVFSQFGIALPRSSYLMADVGKEVELKDCEKGDLIFFTGTDSKVRTVGHVGIVISEKGMPVEFIHCSSGKSKSVVITPMTSEHYQKRFLKVKRIR